MFKQLWITGILVAFSVFGIKVGLGSLAMPSILEAGDITLPQGLNARAFVIRSEKDGLWEKSLIIQFPERRRVISTNDGFVDAMAVVNHSAHPELWKRVCQEMKTKDEVSGKVYSRKIKERNAESLGIRSEDIAQTALLSYQEQQGQELHTQEATAASVN